MSQLLVAALVGGEVDQGEVDRGQCPSSWSSALVRGEVDRGEVGRVEEISAGVCTNRSSEQGNLPGDVSNFIAGFFLYKVCCFSSSP